MSASAPATDAERMDRHYRFQRHIYDATRTHYLIGRKHLLRNLAPPDGGSVLEVGCGTAWNLVRAARRYRDATFHGLDVSNAMLDIARSSVARSGEAKRVYLAQGDATNFSARQLFGVAEFERVFFSYALTMIPEWKAALEQSAACVKPGGELHIVDFGQSEDLPASFKRVLEAFLAHYTVYPRTDMRAALEALAQRHSFSARVQSLHRGYTIYAVLKRVSS